MRKTLMVSTSLHDCEANLISLAALLWILTGFHSSAGALRVLNLLENSRIKADCMFYTTLISACSKAGKVDLLFQVCTEEPSRAFRNRNSLLYVFQVYCWSSNLVKFNLHKKYSSCARFTMKWSCVKSMPTFILSEP